MDLTTVAIVMPLLPLAWLGWLWTRGQHRDAAWWWMAGGFAISWVANVASDYLPANARWVVSAVYPVSQSAIFGAVLLDRTEALMFLALLTPIGIVAAVMGAAQGPDILLRSAAWLVLAAVAWMRKELPQRLRISIVVYFFLGYCTWLMLAAWVHDHPDAHGAAPEWYGYMLAQFAALVLFCWAATENSKLRLVR